MAINVQMNSDQTAEYESYADWLELGFDQEDWRKGRDLLQVEIDQLYNLVDNHWIERTGKLAMAYLNRHHGEQFYIPPSKNDHWTPRNYDLQNANDLGSTEVTLFPNPSKDVVYMKIRSYDNIGVGYFVVYDVLGNIIYDDRISGKESIININLSKWSSGIYFCSVFLDGEIHKLNFQVVD